MPLEHDCIALGSSELAALEDTFEEAWSALADDFASSGADEIESARQKLARIMIGLNANCVVDTKTKALQIFRDSST